MSSIENVCLLHFGTATAVNGLLLSPCLTVCFLLLQLKFIPPLIQAVDFRLNVTAEGATFPSIYVTRVPVTNTSRVFNYTLPRLSFNTSYTLYIRAEGEYQWCPYNELLGKYSDSVVIATADMSQLLSLQSYILDIYNWHIIVTTVICRNEAFLLWIHAWRDNLASLGSRLLSLSG